MSAADLLIVPDDIEAQEEASREDTLRVGAPEGFEAAKRRKRMLEELVTKHVLPPLDARPPPPEPPASWVGATEDDEEEMLGRRFYCLPPTPPPNNTTKPLAACPPAPQGARVFPQEGPGPGRARPVGAAVCAAPHRVNRLFSKPPPEARPACVSAPVGAAAPPTPVRPRSLVDVLEELGVWAKMERAHGPAPPERRSAVAAVIARRARLRPVRGAPGCYAAGHQRLLPVALEVISEIRTHVVPV